MAVTWPSVLVTARSGRGVRVSVSVAELLAGLGSLIPPGAATEAVLLKLPVAEGLMVPVKAKVTVAPGGRFTVWLMFPVPLAAHVPPPAPPQVQLAPVTVPGRVSITLAPVAALGPTFL